MSNEALRLREERDKAKKKYLQAKTRKSREIGRKLNTNLNEPCSVMNCLPYKNRMVEPLE